MKKHIIFITIMAILFNLTGCSNTDKFNINGTKERDKKVQDLEEKNKNITDSNPDESNIKEIKERVEKIQDLDKKIKNTTDDLIGIDIYTKNMCISLKKISAGYSELSDEGKEEMSKYLESEISKEMIDYMLEYIDNDTSTMTYSVSDEIRNLSYQ